ncbi:hypothetical protein M3936_04385 [Sutcliffiella horikoshii]|uniref:hypothetical protein n=1 Tax=Sutcliffiella horikoshii TaxID=79883 RepID=UPI00203E5D74|nr:hypothetical protein [Sutcliffiella horikoshii]MCM3616816.1 hypothetical protein [Sutcliffiella horikoshii]
MDPNEELFRTKQQVIYYRAQIAQYKNKITELEKLLEKELVRSKYLKSKIHEVNNEKIAAFHKEIQSLRKKVLELEVELEEEKNMKVTFNQEPLTQIKNNKEEKINFYSFLNYSIILPKEEDVVSIYGDLTIINNGLDILKELVVCFKVMPPSAATLSGKIADPKSLNGIGRERENIEWVWAVEDWRKKILSHGEYWIKLVHAPTTNKLTFKGFEILSTESAHRGKVNIESYIYKDTNSPPIPSLNKINFQLP